MQSIHGFYSRCKFYPPDSNPTPEARITADFQKTAATRPKQITAISFSSRRATLPACDTLVINEIYLSLQGESTFAGLPCIFIRLTACDLRCSYCDTAYVFTDGKKQSLEEIGSEVRRLAAPFRPPLTSNLNPQLLAAG